MRKCLINRLIRIDVNVTMRLRGLALTCTLSLSGAKRLTAVARVRAGLVLALQVFQHQVGTRRGHPSLVL